LAKPVVTQSKQKGRLRVIFWGAGPLGRSVLEALLQATFVEPALVVTRPDRPAGRGRRPRSCPVKELAEQVGLSVLTPDRPAEVLPVLETLRPDLGLVADYGAFLPEEVVRLPPMGTINVHPSLLPKYRGAAPIQWALANGERETGVSVLYVTEEMDAGDIIRQQVVPIRDDDDAVSLAKRLAEAAGALVVTVLDDMRHGRVQAMPQDHSQATFAPRLKKTDGRVDWNLTASQICNRVRAFQPWPGVYCFPEGEGGPLLHIRKAKAEEGGGRPGEVVDVGPDGPAVAAGEGVVRLLKVQPAGKRVMSGAEFVLGHRVRPGDRWA